MTLGVGCEFSKKFLISLFFLRPTKPLERALTFQLAIVMSSLFIIGIIEGGLQR